MRERIKGVKQNNSAIILIGSNISPEANIRRVIRKFSADFPINKISSTWETTPIGSHSSNFLNLAISIQTELDPNNLKFNILRKFELDLGRVRTDDKYAPRPMDLDIIVYNGIVIDANLWVRAYVALPVAELAPELRHPITGEKISKYAKRLQKDTFAVVRPKLKMKIE